ncbi:MAG: DUF1801 domain-containing protein [Bacteroidota bacterium]
MNQIHIDQQTGVQEKFNAYPSEIREKLNRLRELIIETASDIDTIQEIEERLKWGEPSYSVKKGSPIRIDWKAKSPDRYAMYFNCNTSLVSTFRHLFGDIFSFEKNRAILFNIHEPIPEAELKECIEMALKYHAIKDLPLLGK